MDTLKLNQIIDGSEKQARVVFEASNASVAVRAKQGTDPASSVTVIDGEIDGSAVTLSARREFADGAYAFLSSEYFVVSLDGNPITHGKVSRALRIILGHGIVSLKDSLHVGDVLRAWRKFSVRVIRTFAKMKQHSFFCEFGFAIAARAEYPFSGPNVNPLEVSPVNTDVVFAPLVESRQGAFFAVVIKAVDSSSFTGEAIVYGLRILTGRAQPFVFAQCRELIAKSAPMTAEFFRSSFVAAKTAFSSSVAKHVSSVTAYMQNGNLNVENLVTGEE